MAAPPEVSMKNLSGHWVLNKGLSDDVDSTLALQGIGWFIRKAIGLATVSLEVKQYEGPPSEDSPADAAPVTHIDIEQTATGGLKGTSEHRTLDWSKSTHTDWLFGTVTASSRWSSLEDIEDSFHKSGWLEDDAEKAGPNGEFHLESLAINEENGWTTRQIWGFTTIEGERRYARKIITTKGEEVRRIRLVYDFVKKLDS